MIALAWAAAVLAVAATTARWIAAQLTHAQAPRRVQRAVVAVLGRRATRVMLWLRASTVLAILAALALPFLQLTLLNDASGPALFIGLAILLLSLTAGAIGDQIEHRSGDGYRPNGTSARTIVHWRNGEAVLVIVAAVTLLVALLP